jgi:hypothetical protein
MRAMDDPMLKQIFDRDTDDRKALHFAQRIAALINSRVLPNNKVIVGEGYYPFKVSFHTKAFHCFVLVSDASYCFTANRRPKTPWVEGFRVSFKEPDSVSGVRILSHNLSELIGVKVFRLPRCPDDATDVAFSSALMPVLRKVQFNRVQQFHFSPTRLNVVASLDSPEFCVQQALIFQELVTLANQEAFERNKDALD